MRRLISGLTGALAASVILIGAFTCSQPPGAATAERMSDAAADAIQSTKSAVLPAPAFALSGGGGASIADVAERAVDSVVNISTEKMVRQQRTPFMEDPFFRQFFGRRGPGQMPKERRERSLGSGVVVGDGVILTNNHVIDKASQIRVTLNDGTELDAELAGSDPESDLAVLRIKADETQVALSPISYGDSERLRLGDVVLAVGNPFGVGQTVTMGIVSATGRANVGIVDYEDFIQTDAAINPGNSGGALINLEGKLVGINTAILSRTGGYQGIGFAIPSNMVKSIVDNLLENGKVSRGFLGIAIQDLEGNLAESFGLEPRSGVVVADVNKGSAADEAGLQAGDIITKVNGLATPTTGKLRNLIANAGAGSAVEVELLRDGDEKTVTVNLGERPPHALAKARGGNPSKKPSQLDGLELGSLDAETRARYRIEEDVRQGVVVLDVDRNSPAARAGLRPGDVILEIDRKKVANPGEAKLAYEKAGRSVAFRVRRGDSTTFLGLRKPEGD